MKKTSKKPSIEDQALKILKDNGIIFGTANNYTDIKKCVMQALKYCQEDMLSVLPSQDDIEKAFPTRDPKNIGMASGPPCNPHIQKGANWVLEKIRKSLIKQKSVPADKTSIEPVFPSDLKILSESFDCKKIKNLSDSQLGKLEKELSKEITSVHYANTEEYGYLVVAWTGSYRVTDSDKIQICKVLNKYLEI